MRRRSVIKRLLPCLLYLVLGVYWSALCASGAIRLDPDEIFFTTGTVWNWGEHIPVTVYVAYNQRPLREGVDYTISRTDERMYDEVITVTVTGKGDYEGSVTLESKIEKRAFKYCCTFDVDPEEYEFTGDYIKPTLIIKDRYNGRTLEEGVHYRVTYGKNFHANSGSLMYVYGMGGYYNPSNGPLNPTRWLEQRLYFTITPAPIENAVITMPDETYIYNGRPIEPKIKSLTYNGWESWDSMYTLSYENNISPGTATMKITGKENFYGTVERTFKIQPIDITAASVHVSEQAYTGAALTPRVTVLLSGKQLTEGRDYTLSFKNNKNPGTAAAVVTGKGNYAGVISQPFVIKAYAPLSVSLNKKEVKMLAGKTVTLKAKVSPSGTSAGSVTWSSSNKEIATVDRNGKVKGVKGGTVTITAKAGDRTASCTVRVFNKIRVGLQDGKYYLFTSKLGNFCMTVPDRSKKAGTSLCLIKQNLSGWQKYKAKKVVKGGAEYYALINKNSGLAVTWVKNDFVQKKYTGADSQLFFAMRYSDNSLQLINRLTNRALGVVNGKAARKSNVGPVKFGSGLEQRWIAAVSAK